MAVTMTTYAPFATGAGANVQAATWRQFMRRVAVSGVIRSVNSSGSMTDLLPYGDSTGMQCKVQYGECWIEGTWGSNSGTVTLPVAAADPSNPRMDRIVARSDFLNNIVVLDVLTGTPAAVPVPPAVTRTTSKYEITLGYVNVPAGAVTITAANVWEGRTWGGVSTPTTTNEFLLWGDQLSSVSRTQVTAAASIAFGNTYLNQMVTPTDMVISQIRWWVDTKQVGGGAGACAIYTGQRLDDLTLVAQPAVDFINGPSAAGTSSGSGVLYNVSFTPIQIAAGTRVFVFVTPGTSGTQAPTLGCTANQLASTVNSGICNPGKTTNILVGFKALAPPLTAIKAVNDNTWTLRGLIPWVALA